VQPIGDGVLQVEPTDHCNLSCSMCAPHHERWETVHGIAKGMLDPQLWEQILDGLVADDCRFDHIIFQWLGDPSLHPALPDLIRSTVAQMSGRVGYLRVDTNGILLTPDRIDQLIDVACLPDAPPILIVFTVDAASEPVYTRVKGQDALSRVRRHIRHLIRRRREHGEACRINLQIQFVVQEGNAHEAGAFLSYWRGLLDCQSDKRWHDEILFKRLSVGGGSKGQAEADELYRQTVERFEIHPGALGDIQIKTWESRPWQQDDAHDIGSRTACPGLWLTPVIRHDGHLMMCCADLRGELDLGSLSENGYRDLWDGPKATQLRMRHLEGRFDGVCAGCGGINWYDLTEDMKARAIHRATELNIESALTADTE
jgi:MoaA/NifB/PqqE/SkfB family radical SAM enzyme